MEIPSTLHDLIHEYICEDSLLNTIEAKHHFRVHFEYLGDYWKMGVIKRSLLQTIRPMEVISTNSYLFIIYIKMNHLSDSPDSADLRLYLASGCRRLHRRCTLALWTCCFIYTC